MDYKILQDPVFGPIRLQGVFRDLVDSKEFQRLRRIKSLGLCNMIFPGANHTRFEHSIGTYFLATKYLSHFSMDDDEFLAAALLHDIGHFPFSHTIEEFYYGKYGVDHLDTGIALIQGDNMSDIPVILEKYGLSVGRIVSILKKDGNPIPASLVSGPIDVDELDYLRRDSFYCGVSMGYANPDRIIAISAVEGNEVIAEEKGLFDIESLLVSRFLMYQAVYFHKTCRIANRMLERAMLQWKYENRSYNYDDERLSQSLLNDPDSGYTMKRIINRNLMKVAAKIKYSKERYDRAISLLSDSDAIIDVIPPLSFNGRDRIKIDLKVRIAGETTGIENVSPLIKSLLEAMDRRYILIYSDKPLPESVLKDLKDS